MCDVRLVMNLHFLFLWYIHKILVKYMKGEKKKWSAILFITEMVKLAYADINDKIHYYTYQWKFKGRFWINLTNLDWFLEYLLPCPV